MTRHDQAPRLPTTTLAMAMAAVAVVGCNALVLSPVLREVAGSLRTTPVAVSRAIAAYSGATAVSALLLAGYVGRLGERRALAAGLALLTAALLASAAAPTAWLLATAQAAAGLGAGVILPGAYGLATGSVPPHLRARALGVVLTGWSVSLVAGVPVAAATADAIGWRLCFVGLALLSGAVLSAALHRRGEAAARSEVVRPWQALAVAGVPALLLVCAAYMASFYGVYAFLAEAVRARTGISAGRAGLLVLAYGLGFGLAALGDGAVDRVGPRRLFAPTLLVLAALYLAMPWTTWSLPEILAVSAAWGLANHAGLNILVGLLSAADPARRATVLGLNSAVTYAAAMLGVVWAGWLRDAAGFDAVPRGAAALMAAAALAWWRRR